MASVVKSGKVSLASKVIPEQTRFGSGLICGEDIAAGDACYVKPADGLVYRSIGTTAGTDAARVVGFALKDCKVAQQDAITLVRDVDLRYGVGFLGLGYVGKPVYLDSAVAGGLSTTATTGGTGIVGTFIDDTRIRVLYSTY